MATKQVKKKPQPQENKANPKTAKALKFTLAFLVAAFAFMLYAQSIGFDFAYDDVGVIKENKLVHKGFGGISTLMKTDRLYGFDGNRTPEYRPTSLVLFAVVWQFFPNSSAAAHFVNVLLFALTCYLLFMLLFQLFSNLGSDYSHLKLLFPFICSMFYAAHPIHTEVVDNIKSCDEILTFLFAVLSGIFLLKFAIKNVIVNLIFGSIFYFLSILSKESGISFLLVLPLMIFVFTKSDLKKMMMISGSLILVTGLFFFIRSQVIDSTILKLAPALTENVLVGTNSFIEQRVTALFFILKYIYLLLFPYQLSYDYSFAESTILSFSSPLALLAIAAIGGIAIYSFIKIPKRSILAFGILFFLLTLAPVSNIFLLIASTMAERFMYIPSFGFCIALAFILIKITKSESIKNKFNTISEFFKTYSMVLTVSLVIVMLFAIRTYSRSQVWHDDFALYSNDVNVVGKSARAHYNYATSLLFTKYPKEKNQEEKNKLNDMAIVEFTKAVNIQNTYSDAYFNLAMAYEKKTDYQNALKNYEVILKLAPSAKARIYNAMGLVYKKAGQLQQSLNILDSAIYYNPKYPEPHNAKGFALVNIGRMNDAIEEYQKAIALNPQYSEAYKNLGSTYGNMKEFTKAMECFKKANEYDPNDPQAVNYIGLTYKMLGDSVNGKMYMDKAMQMMQATK
ncbi:MAG: tetratricopeptide repeat protein [Bacteroidota bacterium]